MSYLAISGNALIALAVLAQILALSKRRVSLIAPLALLASMMGLVGALLGDSFELSYVANYSAHDLPVWLKVATVWGGEEGNLLLLASLYTGLAWRYRERSAASSRSLALMGLAFALACFWWNPFATTGLAPAADGKGMNAHLTSFWMAIHPPAVFIAYALLWAPLGASLEALGGRDRGAWRAMVTGPGLAGWALLTVGVASGMWWAFQDFNYGQFWHWDPVQTAALTVWLLATAQLHGARQTLTAAAAPRVAMWAGVLTAWSIPVALWIVRDATLASSHRYVGDTSWPLMALVTFFVTIAPLRFSRKAGGPERPTLAGVRQLLQWASLSLVAAAAATAGVLAYSYVCAAASCPRSFAPFRESLMSWVSSREAAHLTAVFDQWEVDHFVAIPLLLPAVAVVVILLGYTFVRPVLRYPFAWTVLFALTAAVFALWWQPLRSHFDGTGVTTSHTVANFVWLEILLLWCLWPALAIALWLRRVVRRQGWQALNYSAPVGAIHLGVIALVVGATVSMTLDKTRQASLILPDQYGQAVELGRDLNVTIEAPRWHVSNDGAIGSASSLTALSDVSMTLRGLVDSTFLGTTSYRDRRERVEAEGGQNTFRQRCTILDYRFARATEQPGLMMHPAISHAWLRDTQIWLPAVEPGVDANSKREVLLVLRQFPLLSVLWTGLMLIVGGALLLLVTTRLARRQG